MALIRGLVGPPQPLRWLMASCILGSLLMLFLLGSSEMHWDPNYSLRYSRLDYKDTGEGPDDVFSCSAVLQGDPETLDKVKTMYITKDFQKRALIPDEYYINITKDCRNFKLTRSYITFPLSKEEEEFPLAYSLVVHHKVENFERLLRAIYAPQNVYCVHVDKKATISVFAAIMSITSCFPNVFMVSRPVSVVYAAWSRVQADINCMADLYNVTTTWKYFINLCGQDFPLKTNLEIVRSLQSLRGGNSMESEQMPEGKRSRVIYSYQIVNGKIQNTGQTKEPPPFNLPILSGNAYIIVNRGYVRSVLEDPRIQTLIDWAKDTYSPDEFLWATIQRIPSVPGSTWPSTKYDMTDVNAIARIVKWQWHEGSYGAMGAVYPECHGNHVRSICIYGAGDLQWLIEQHHLFANKFDADKDPVTLRCLEKYLRTKALEIH